MCFLFVKKYTEFGYVFGYIRYVTTDWSARNWLILTHAARVWQRSWHVWGAVRGWGEASTAKMPSMLVVEQHQHISTRHGRLGQAVGARLPQARSGSCHSTPAVPRSSTRCARACARTYTLTPVLPHCRLTPHLISCCSGI